jgi:ATP-dependent Lon protease
MCAVRSYPVLPVRYSFLFPGITLPLTIKSRRSIAAVDFSGQKTQYEVIVVAQQSTGTRTPELEDLYQVGCLAQISEISRGRRKGYLLEVLGTSRFRISEFIRRKKFILARGESLPDERDGTVEELAALVNTLREIVLEVIKLLPKGIYGASHLVQRLDDPVLLTHFCSTILDASMERKQELLETVSLRRRMEMLIESYKKHRDTLRIQNEIGRRLTRNLLKEEREALLREQLKTIQEQLGESENAVLGEIRERIENAGMNESVLKVARNELKRLEQMGLTSPEAPFIRTYLDWLAALPWRTVEHKVIEMDEAKRILEADHFGLDKVKKRIIEHLAVIKLKSDLRGPILCFVGPPGVGKTSLGQSIARALGRPFVRTSLGGLRDEAEISGHRRTYVGAMPGRIIQAIRRAGRGDALLMLDEIDKLSIGFQGDPASALLEVLDPEQNKGFVDHYMDVPYDLSNIFFIATANTLETIPHALLDRMEVVEIAGYSIQEKLQIARQYIVPRQLKEYGIQAESVQLSDDTLQKIIVAYTHEAGIRELQRVVAALLRSVAASLVDHKQEQVCIDSNYVADVLGPEKFIPEASARMSLPGVVSALAWTPMGGEILFVEVRAMAGKGQLVLTGQLGDVMKESAQIAVSIARSEAMSLSTFFDFEKRDLHIHVPSGAIQKDGPSAGVAILCAIVSLITGKRVDTQLVMTGEITLRGVVLPVGGIKEKVIAAHRAGFKRVLLPNQNEKDLRDVPQEVRSELQFMFIENIVGLMEVALGLAWVTSAEVENPPVSKAA